MRILIFVSGLLCLGPVLAGEYPIAIKTDSRGEYFVVEKGGSPERPTLLVKWVGPDGKPYYVKRMFDCRARTVQYLGEGDTPEQAAKLLPDQKMSPADEGSIAGQLANHVCPKR